MNFVNKGSTFKHHIGKTYIVVKKYYIKCTPPLQIEAEIDTKLAEMLQVEVVQRKRQVCVFVCVYVRESVCKEKKRNDAD